MRVKWLEFHAVVVTNIFGDRAKKHQRTFWNSPKKELCFLILAFVPFYFLYRCSDNPSIISKNSGFNYNILSLIKQNIIFQQFLFQPIKQNFFKIDKTSTYSNCLRLENIYQICNSYTQIFYKFLNYTLNFCLNSLAIKTFLACPKTSADVFLLRPQKHYF